MSEVSLKFGIPALLWALPFAVAPLLGIGPVGAAILWSAIVLHAVGADWLLSLPLPANLGTAGVLSIKLLIGAPTAVFAAAMITTMVVLDDDGWMVLPFVVLPAMIVWPYLLISMMRDVPVISGARPTKSES